MTEHDPEYRPSALRPLIQVATIAFYPALWLTLLLMTLGGLS
jgi:hypothetical protein